MAQYIGASLTVRIKESAFPSQICEEFGIFGPIKPWVIGKWDEGQVVGVVAKKDVAAYWSAPLIRTVWLELV